MSQALVQSTTVCLCPPVGQEALPPGEGHVASWRRAGAFREKGIPPSAVLVRMPGGTVATVPGNLTISCPYFFLLLARALTTSRHTLALARSATICGDRYDALPLQWIPCVCLSRVPLRVRKRGCCWLSRWQEWYVKGSGGGPTMGQGRCNMLLDDEQLGPWGISSVPGGSAQPLGISAAPGVSARPLGIGSVPQAACVGSIPSYS